MTATTDFDREREVPIAEQFYSIQGEGPYAGTPAVFLRTAGCNLLCGDPEGGYRDNVEQEDLEPSDDATWVCDTIEVWKEADENLSPSEIVSEWHHDKGWFEHFSDGAHLVLTGGEPMIPQRQADLADLLDYIQRTSFPDPFVEVETNGTFEPVRDFAKHVNAYNVSLKLSNSGMSEDRRIDPDAIADFISYYESPEPGPGATFKFVASRQEDVEEIFGLQDRFGIPDGMIMLMPAGYDQETLHPNYGTVAELCKEQGWRFSPRLHVTSWDQATGV